MVSWRVSVSRWSRPTRSGARSRPGVSVRFGLAASAYGGTSTSFIMRGDASPPAGEHSWRCWRRGRGCRRRRPPGGGRAETARAARLAVEVVAHGLEVLAGQLTARVAGLEDLEGGR